MSSYEVFEELMDLRKRIEVALTHLDPAQMRDLTRSEVQAAIDALRDDEGDDE